MKLNMRNAENVDEVCRQLNEYANALTKLLANGRLGAPEQIVSMVKVVVEVRRELLEMLSVKDGVGLDAELAERLLVLAGRYQIIEGAFKEARNDMHSSSATEKTTEENKIEDPSVKERLDW